ncbi:LOW QUALITY PROTEIN: uncharacterized protein LOC118205552 [Stegodyphus dumicola]|uniref:LOW QUALITY PROTEIN: uncharacterized protein LOC118205552 n=1 Tax=Stegodyphus dumicola TaxID=202533 RepID=UPI0015A8720B|nr:LOW QUALITY PROTEIN: uncharacterized protein LOC118205552 [Stegodyphus dumicola]
MEFTKKYVLVPEEMMTKHTISDKQLSELDKAMMHILNSSVDDREKLVRYYELLQKKLNLKEYNSPFKPPKDDSQNSLDDSAEMKKVKEEEEAPSSVTDGDKQMTVTDYSTVILDSVPLRMRRKAQNALAILKRHPDILKWNDKGEQETHNKIKVSLQFIDSFQFLNTSLEKLVQNLPAEKFNILKENVREGDLSLLLKKGIYPYDYIQSFEMFEETALPPPAAFHNSLTDEEISASDYEHAQAVWNSFNIRTMGEYHDLYVKSDVLQLADVFENFRKLCLQFYEIDCAHVMTSPGLSWQACLKMIEQPLELLTDVDMHLFIEQGIRGGISVITKRWAQANNHYMPNYDSTNPESYIMYLDANNLYGWAMSQALPYGEFEWISAEAVTPEWILSISENSTEGYILEVDLENILPYQNFNSQIKLIPNLKHKQNYIVYYKNLQFYLKEGLRLTAVHRILKFKQKAWLKPYIDFNTEQRKNSKSAFEKDFFKLLNNSIYGKTMENIRNHVNVQLVNERKKAEKIGSCPTFKRFQIFSENLVAVERLKNTLTLNRPIYVGFVILELSKILMYNFHYNIIKKEYGENASLLFTDTDSLTYEIRTKDVYEDMKHRSDIYDTSDYPPNHPLYSQKNMKKIGCMKDEFSSKLVYEFVGLRAKMYSFLSETGEKKTAKGVSRHVVRSKILHENYKHCLQNLQSRREIQYRIASEEHHLFTLRQNKLSLSPFDDKRYILEDGIHTLAYGHYKIEADKEKVN